MSEYAIIFQVLGAVVALFIIFLTYMSTKTWRWVHVTFMFLVFAASFTFCIYAAMVLKTRAAWVKNLDNLEKQYDTAADQLEKTTRGDPKDIEDKTDSLVSVREELARTTIDRGRVWRGCTPSINRQTGAIIVQTSPPPDPNNPAAGPAKKHNIGEKTIVHAFREAEFRDPQNPDNVTIVPASYIGEFRVIAPITDQSVSLQPTMALGADQQVAATIAGTWTLYETAPVDGHEWLTVTKDDQGNAHVLPLEGALQLAMQVERAQFPPATIQQILDPYRRDGSEAQPTDSPENVWYRVLFDQEYDVTVDAPIVNSIDTDPFNTEGQAVLQRLRRKGATPDEPGKVTFGPKEGQIHWALLDSQTAQSLIDRGVAKLDEGSKPIYRRKLNDYDRRFHAINDGITDINGRLKQLDLDNKAMLAATEKANQQQQLVEELKNKVNADLVKVRYELAEMEKYTASLSNRLTTVQTQLSELYQSNKTINRELSELTARLTDEIDRRTREATARNP